MALRRAFTRAVSKLLGGAAGRHFADLLGTLDRTVEQGRRLFALPSPIYRPPYAWHRFTPEQGLSLIQQLRRHGLIMLPGFLDKARLLRTQASIAGQFAAMLGKEMEFRPDQHDYSCRQPLAISPELAEAAIDADLLNLVSGYFRRKPFLSESDFRRVLPLDLAEHERRNAKFAKGYSPSHWHHDLHGRELKAMIYLTDVGPADQDFAYCLGSHTGFRSTKYENSRFTDAQVETMKLEILECLAPAGTAIVFDTNGIHRLRRRNTRIRDSVTFNYHPGRMCQISPQHIHPDILDQKRAEFLRLMVLAGR